MNKICFFEDLQVGTWFTCKREAYFKIQAKIVIIGTEYDPETCIGISRTQFVNAICMTGENIGKLCYIQEEERVAAGVVLHDIQ